MIRRTLSIAEIESLGTAFTQNAHNIACVVAPGEGGTPGNSWWGVPPGSSNPDPISDQKM